MVYSRFATVLLKNRALVGLLYSYSSHRVAFCVQNISLAVPRVGPWVCVCEIAKCIHFVL